jgi:hypothetical protein
MKHISILIPNGQYSVVNIGASFQIFNWANDTYMQQTRKRLFQVELVALKSPATDAEGFYSINPAKTIELLQKTELIIIPAAHGDLQ